jgi:hypothetical protein
MAAFNKFHCFVKDLAEKKHDFAADTFKVALTNRAPVQATDRLLADIVELGAGNGYAAGGNAAAVVSSAQAAGVYKSVLADPVLFTAVGGALGPFRYAVLYNATSGLVIGWWDYGSNISLAVSETFTVDLDQVAGIFTVT